MGAAPQTFVDKRWLGWMMPKEDRRFTGWVVSDGGWWSQMEAVRWQKGLSWFRLLTPEKGLQQLYKTMTTCHGPSGHFREEIQAGGAEQDINSSDRTVREIRMLIKVQLQNEHSLSLCLSVSHSFSGERSCNLLLPPNPTRIWAKKFRILAWILFHVMSSTPKPDIYRCAKNQLANCPWFLCHTFQRKHSWMLQANNN